MIKPHLLATCIRRDTGLTTFLHNEYAAQGSVLGDVWVALISSDSADGSGLLGIVFFKSEELTATPELHAELLKQINKDLFFFPSSNSRIQLNNLGHKTCQGIAEFEAIAHEIIAAHSGSTFVHDNTNAMPKCKQVRPTF